MLKHVQAAMPIEVERLVERTIGCGIRVHAALGPGLLEGLYHDAFAIELELSGLRFDRELPLIVHYRGHPLRKQRIDLVVERQVIVELKAVTRLEPIHQAQLISYLRSSGIRVGLLMNFHAEVLKAGLRRIVV